MAKLLDINKFRLSANPITCRGAAQVLNEGTHTFLQVKLSVVKSYCYPPNKLASTSRSLNRSF